MIEIITEEVKMPALYKRRFQKQCKNAFSRSEKWFVIDTKDKTVRFKGRFEDVALACHSLNKKYYRDLKTKLQTKRKKKK